MFGRIRILWLLALLAATPTAAETAQWMLLLEDPPAVTVWAATHEQHRADDEPARRRAATAAVRSHLARVETAQRHLLANLAEKSADGGTQPRALFRVQRVLNAIAVFAPAHDVADLATLPGVRAVHPVVPKRRTNSTSVPFLGSPTVWNAGGLGATGAGVRLGIIDTGIDYLHTTFGGSGLAEDYAANDPTTLADGFFPSLKVAGGYDFVGDAYDASNPAQATPLPDPDPMDCNGHGTHVAGTAAGFGTHGDGTTYAGAYGPELDFDALGIGPGVAPEAILYALKVFGCTGETAVVEQALEWAVDPDGNGDFSDHLDVVNLSLTSPLGAADDPTALAANNAALAGVMVVASAGNDGAQHFLVGSPATADHALAVAATWDPDATFPARAVRIDSPAEIAGTHQAGGANFGPNLLAPLSGEAVRATPPDACAPLTNPPAEIDGRIAVIDRTDACTFVTQVRHAQNAGTTGAIAVVLVNDRPGLEGIFNDGTGADITIPSLHLRQVAGQAIQDQLPGLVELTLTPTVLEDMFAVFSSRGPRRGTQPALKPDLAAPGVAITSARLGASPGGGTGSSIKSGTSMASPHVAGAAALLRQLHPSWTPQEVKALLMNTAGDVYYDPELTPPVLTPVHMGSGRLRPADAAVTEVIAFNAAEPAQVGVSFGSLQVATSTTMERWVRFVNHGAAEVVYALDLTTLSDIPGVTASLPDGSQVTVPAGGEAEIRLRLAVERSALRHTHDPTLDEASLGFPRHWLSEEAGLLLARPLSGAETVDLRVPYYAVVRPAAAVAATETELELGPAPTGTTSLPLTGLGVDTGNEPPRDVLSLVSAFELQQVGGGEPEEPAFVGVTTDFPARPGLAESLLYFGIATQEPWSTLHEVALEIYLDTNRDGTADFLLTNTDEGTFTFNFPTDAFVGVLHDLNTSDQTLQAPINNFSPTDRATAAFLTNVALLTVRAADLGLAPGASAFEYSVAIHSRLGAGGIARTPPAPRRAKALGGTVLTYDPTAPGLTFTGGQEVPPLFPDLGGAHVPVEFHLTAFSARGSLGLLLLHHHGSPDQRSEVVGIVDLGALFADGFETADTAAWSAEVP